MYIWFDMFLLYCSTYFVTFRRVQKDKDLITLYQYSSAYARPGNLTLTLYTFWVIMSHILGELVPSTPRPHPHSFDWPHLSLKVQAH